jgi:hypothetical protein
LFSFNIFQRLPWTERGEKGFGSSGLGLAVKCHSDGLKRQILEKALHTEEKLDAAKSDREVGGENIEKNEEEAASSQMAYDD